MVDGISDTSDKHKYNPASTTMHVEGHAGQESLAADATAKGGFLG